MGKGSSSQKTSNTYNNYNLQGTDADNVVVGSNNVITDHGAIKGALDFAGEAVSSSQVVSLAAMEHTSDAAEMATGAVSDAWRDSSKLTVDTVSDAWRDSSKLVANAATSAADLVATESTANIERISEVNNKASDRIEKMATAVATDGQNLIAQSNVKNLYIVGGVSVLSVIAMAVMAARSKK